MNTLVIKFFAWVTLILTVPICCNGGIIKDSSEHTDGDFYVDYVEQYIATDDEGTDSSLEEDDEDLTSSGVDLDEEDYSGDESVFEKYDESTTPRDFMLSEVQKNTTGSSSTVDYWDEEKNIAYRIKLSWFLAVLWAISCVLLSLLLVFCVIRCVRSKKHKRTAIFSLFRTGYHQQVNSV